MSTPDGPAGPPPEAAAARQAPDAARRVRRPPVRRTGHTLAFVESPVQLLNVLEWAHADALRAARTQQAGTESGAAVPGPRRGASAPAEEAGAVATGAVPVQPDGGAVTAARATGSGPLYATDEPAPTSFAAASASASAEATPVATPAGAAPATSAEAAVAAATPAPTPSEAPSASIPAPATPAPTPAEAASASASAEATPLATAAEAAPASPAEATSASSAEEAPAPTPSEAAPAPTPADVAPAPIPAPAAPVPTPAEAVPAAPDQAGPGRAGQGSVLSAGPGPAGQDGAAPEGPSPHDAHGDVADITVVVLAPNDPMTRGQLRRMAELARDEGISVTWQDARGGPGAPFQTVGGLAPALRRARRVVVGDPFSRYVQLLLTLTRAREVVVVDDGTATMEFVSQLASGEPLVRWHRSGRGGGARDAVFAPVSAVARRRLTPRAGRRTVEVFSSMPVEPPDGVSVIANDFSWTRARFGPPALTRGADIVGTSLAETGVVDLDRYIGAVSALARAHGATRYFAHRRESADKLHRLSVETGLEIVRPDLPLELIARRGPIGGTILSFPSTVVHTLPLALAGTDVKVAVCDIDPAWLTDTASPRAQGFLSGVTGTARDVHRLPSAPATP